MARRQAVEEEAAQQQESGPNGGMTDASAGATTEEKKAKKTPQEKRDDFIRLASARVSRALDALSSLSHLSSTQSYDWTEEQESEIFDTLQSKLVTVHSAFIDARQPKEGRKKAPKNLSFRVSA